MKIWLPYIHGGSGTDTFTQSFADALSLMGHDVVIQSFHHMYQYQPALLKGVSPPPVCNAMVTNSWNGFVFDRPGVRHVTMEQLCVHDPTYDQFRSAAQRFFHNNLVRRFERRSFEAADAVVAVSEYTRRAVATAFQGVTPHVVMNGIDTSYFTPVTRTRGEQLRILFVGNPTLRKGVDVLAPLMNRLGDGFVLEYTAGLQGRDGLGIPNSVNLGKLDRAEVLAAYRRADVFLFPTRLEGLPLSVLEAMSCGLPVVGSDLTSMPEAVEHGVTGLLGALDPDWLEAQIRELATNDELRHRMGEAARQTAVERFDISRTAAGYLRLLGV